MRRLQSLAFFFVFSLFVAAAASAQKVVVVWGDSVTAGLNSHVTTHGGPPTPVPGPPVLSNARRWDSVNNGWIDVKKTQNIQNAGVDPVYGFASSYIGDTDPTVYFIELALPQTDCNSNPDDPRLSWHPLVTQGVFGRLRTDIQDALAHPELTNPTLECIFFSCGNNEPSQLLPSDIQAVNNAIEAQFLTSNAILVGTRSYVLDDPDTTLNRQEMLNWRAGAQNRRLVDLTKVPERTDGLPDGVHMGALGVYTYGYLAGLAAQ